MTQEVFQRSIQSHSAVKRTNNKAVQGGKKYVTVFLSDEADEFHVEDIVRQAENAGATRANFNSMKNALEFTINC